MLCRRRAGTSGTANRSAPSTEAAGAAELVERLPGTYALMRHPEDLGKRLIDATTPLPANPMRSILMT
jgi:hypothetical protein